MAARNCLLKLTGSPEPSASGVPNDTPSKSKPIDVIRKRPDFLAANRGKRFVTPGFVLLVHKRRDGHPVPADIARYGITVTKKIGNAVTRNRMKRRFRAIAAQILPQHGIAGADHILIGRKTSIEPEYSELLQGFEKGLKHVARKL